jgi:hypothetical protein
MRPLEKEDEQLYDRQIRLFGFETQVKMKNYTAYIFSKPKDAESCEGDPKHFKSERVSYLAGELIKNFALLGVEKIYTDVDSYHAFLEMVPTTLELINERIEHKITEIEKMECAGENTIVVFVDTLPVVGDAYFICTRCLSFEITTEHTQCMKLVKGRGIALDCLLGAIFVQEFVKMVKGDKHLKEYRLATCI